MGTTAPVVAETLNPEAPEQGVAVQGGTVPAREGLRGARLWLATVLVLAVALVALVPTTGDIGLTWDEPAYRYSQILSAQWWEQLIHARSWSEIRALMAPDALLYYWPYGRFGINFHPPLAGQLNLAAHAVFGSWMKDIPSQRMASVIEFALTIAIGFQFLARRYGAGAGLVMAGSLLLMPRLYGQAHLIDTDIPGLLLWAATALAFWKGLHEEHARPWRVLVGVLLGLAFVEKMAAVGVLLPLLLWLIAGRLPRTFTRPGGRADWIDGVVTTGLMLVPLGLAFHEVQGLQRQLPPPDRTDLFVHGRDISDWPGGILALPLAVWLVRRLLGRVFPGSRVWGAERPALEIWTAILAFAPLVGWLGNPAWWRETLPRLAHYYTITSNRELALPRIQIIYFGQIYEYSLPWHNAWVLMGITVPVTILLASGIGILWGLAQVHRDRVPLYLLLHLLTLPALRMLPTPAHDGVRLFLPTFFFLAAFSGWGTSLVARAVSRILRMPAPLATLCMGALMLVPAAFELVRIHPFELSYYNALIGGPSGAWHRGFELTYWFDAFNGQTLDDLNRNLPPGAQVEHPNELTKNTPTFQELQTLGALRGDIKMGIRAGEPQPDRFPFVWMQTQDSKASAFSRLLFAMRPWYARQPAQVDGLRLVTVADPAAVSRAWALQVLLDATDRSRPDPPAAPEWVRTYAPILDRFWGDGLKKIHRLTLNQGILDWARSDPHGFLEASRFLAAHKGPGDDPDARRLVGLITDDPSPQTVKTRTFVLDRLLKARPEGLVEAARILIQHTDEVVKVMTRYGYTDPRTIGGFLDRDLTN
jgi:hypothetical protein